MTARPARRRRVALASCASLPEWEVDDQPLLAAFATLGVDAESVAWDAPVDWSAYQGCLLRTTWDYSERLEDFLAWTRRAAELTRLLNSAPLIAWNARKTYLRDLAERGVATIPTEWIAAGGQLPDFEQLLEQREWSRAFLKPVVGASARLTLPFELDPAGCAAALALIAAHPAEAWMLQPFLPSVFDHGEVSAVFIAGELTHGVRKVPVAGDYRVQDDYGAHDEPWQPSPGEQELAKSIVAALPEPVLYARVDWLRDPRGELLVTEVEAIEPSLFFRHCPAAATRLAESFLAAVGAP